MSTNIFKRFPLRISNKIVFYKFYYLPTQTVDVNVEPAVVGIECIELSVISAFASDKPYTNFFGRFYIIRCQLYPNIFRTFIPLTYNIKFATMLLTSRKKCHRPYKVYRV